MKKALSLIEVLVSVVLITIVIGAMLQVNSQAIHALNKIKENSLNSSALQILTVVAFNTTEDKKYYLSDLVEFEESQIDKKLKEMRFEIDFEEETTQTIQDDQTRTPIDITPSTIEIFNDQIKKTLIRMRYKS